MIGALKSSSRWPWKPTESRRLNWSNHIFDIFTFLLLPSNLGFSIYWGSFISVIIKWELPAFFKLSCAWPNQRIFLYIGCYTDTSISGTKNYSKMTLKVQLKIVKTFSKIKLLYFENRYCEFFQKYYGNCDLCCSVKFRHYKILALSLSILNYLGYRITVILFTISNSDSLRMKEFRFQGLRFLSVVFWSDFPT